VPGTRAASSLLRPGEVRIGTSGWSYDHWNGVLYPPGTPAVRRLEAYRGSFDTVELNASFYRWPPDRNFASWRDRLPETFLLTVKAPRGLTHARKLSSPEVWAPRIERSLRILGPRAGFLLLQLPPDFARDDERLETALTALGPVAPLAVELRHPSWVDDEVFAILERHRAAYCVMSGAALPCELRATSDVVYVRFHGPDRDHLYAGSYSDADLDWWADRIREWTGSGRGVVAYFNNDGEGNAVRDARRLRARLE
jgi:uncharacterized protein YecE (DUF72 family)